MRPNQSKMFDFLGKGWTFNIPIYQRRYSWNKDNCARLYDDLKMIYEKNLNRHFFGSVVFCNVYGDEKSVIDGQQRLTTVSLLLLAIRNLLRQNEIRSAQSDAIVHDIYSLLTIRGEDENTVTKIRLHGADSETLEKMIISDHIDYDEESRLYANYRYFYDRIRVEEEKDPTHLDKLYDAIKKLEIITLELGHDDSAQQIFESINSTGTPLTVGDKIRNYILMGLSDKPREQNELYGIWEKIECYATYEGVDDFIKCFLTINRDQFTKVNDAYSSFRKYAEVERKDDGIDLPDGTPRMNSPDYVRSLLNELLKYAKYYNVLRTNACNFRNKKKEMNYCLRRLSEYCRHTTYPFFMKVLYHQENGELRLREEDVLEIFELTESFLFRRSIYGISSKSDDKMFASLDRQIMDCNGEPNDYLSRFKYIITNMDTPISHTFKFPNDDEFKDSIKRKNDFYAGKRDTRYILERFEHSLRDRVEYDDDLYALIIKTNENEGWSIEHVMPQKAGIDSWPVLSGYPEGTRDAYINKLGNLSFSGYNDELNNSSFYNKCLVVKGHYSTSGVQMNQEIYKGALDKAKREADKADTEQDILERLKWGPQEIDERTEMLANRAVEMWKYPEVDFTPAGIECYTLAAEDGLLADRTLHSFSLQYPDGSVRTEKCSGWPNMYKVVVTLLQNKYPNVLSEALDEADQNLNLHEYLSASEDLSPRSYKVADRIYVRLANIRNGMLNDLRRIFDLYSLDYANLTFYLGDKRKRGQRHNDNTRREAIFKILDEWAQERAETTGNICYDSMYSSDPNGDQAFMYVRFTTPQMSDILPLCEDDGDSDWHNKHHYFYEICNWDGKKVLIQLALNSTGASDEFKEKCDVINRVRHKRNRKRWQWRISFKTSQIDIGENICRQDIFDGLDNCMVEVSKFESDVKEKFDSTT